MIQKDNVVFALAGTIIGMILGVLLVSQTTIHQTAPAPVQQQAVASQPETQQPQQQAEQALPKGHPAIDDSAMRKQLEVNQEILEKDPENQQAIVAVANISSDLKEYPQAILYYEKALKNDPKNINLMTDLATSYFYSNNPDKALQLYGQSLTINPKHFQSLMNVGIVKMAVGDKKGAAEAWEKVVAYYPDSKEAAQLKSVMPQLKQGS